MAVSRNLPLPDRCSLTLISQLEGLTRAGTVHGLRDGAADRAVVEHDIGFDRRMAPQVEDHSPVHIDDDAHEFDTKEVVSHGVTKNTEAIFSVSEVKGLLPKSGWP